MSTQSNPEVCPAAFLDRDGTLIVEYGFLADPTRVEPLPGAFEAVRLLNSWGYRVIGVSNQSGVARGYYGADTVDAVNVRVVDTFAEQDARIDHIYYCIHLPLSSGAPGAADCQCRKPLAGMIQQAQQDFAIDLPHSFTAGDRACDVGLGQTVNIPGILLLTGYGRTEHANLPAEIVPAFVADDLLAAVRWWGERTGRL
jgi:D-glycero-D-manno-heptose 1,7-bisphosphate phosphatase